MMVLTGTASVAVAAQRVVLTNADDGRSVAATPGDAIEVRLTGSRSHGLTYVWSIPTSSNPATLRRTAGSTTPTGGASAVFHAQHSGVATIQAERKCRADAGYACPMVVELWKATVAVK
jgi:hypothetical protein